jgi:hypothetical protein
MVEIFVIKDRISFRNYDESAAFARSHGSGIGEERRFRRFIQKVQNPKSQY